jgi:5-methyltetrahydropteroyltriglutamate--homocysteine methyltransferase
MRRSTDRIIVSHAGTLPKPEGLTEAGLDEAVAAIVRKQAELGIDIVNDGELPKMHGGFNLYIRERMTGVTQHKRNENEEPVAPVFGRDLLEFPGYHSSGLGGFNFGPPSRNTGSPPAPQDPFYCSGTLSYVGQRNVEADIARLKAACEGLDVEPYLPAISPGTIEHWLKNEYYPDRESLLFAISDVMHEEYKAITDAGIVLQIDDPDLPDAWQMFPQMSIADYRDYATLRMEAINRALQGIDPELVRHHVCWGSQHGPHKNDIALKEIVDIVVKVNSSCLSIEAANPVHEHEWVIWKDVKLPEGKTLMPGAVGHVTDLIERPELVAQRLVRYASVVGRENVVAGTDCGIGTRVGHGEIAWAKLSSLVEGARLASKELWG